MKILYHHRIASKDGQYVHLQEMVHAFTQLGHEVLIVGPNIVETDAFGASGGIVPLLKKNIPKALYEILEFSYTFYDLIKTLYHVRRFKPDCIYERYNLLFISGIWIKKLVKLPLLLEINAPLFEERNHYHGISLQRFARWTEKYCWQQADAVLPVTQVLADKVTAAVGARAQVEVIHNGINEQRFKHVLPRNAAKEKLNLAGKTILGFTGFVREWHGIERVIDFLHTHRDENLHCLLVGDGPARAFLEQYAEQKGVASQCTITGIIGRDDVADYIAAFDVALQPAVVAYASPLKMFEYLALGCIILAPNADNIKEILDDGVNAVLFDSNAKNAFNAGLQQAITHCGDAKMRQQAINTIQNKQFTWCANARRVTQLFSTFIGND